MAPTLIDGMTIEVERASPEAVKTADIIFYKKNGQMVVHRVIGILNEEKRKVFVTKGDNQAYIESDYIDEKSLVGVVRGAFREDRPQANILVDSRFIGASYLAMGNLAIYTMALRRYVPRPLRLVLRYFTGAFFLLFKNTIHIVYKGMSHAQLFFRRYGG